VTQPRSRDEERSMSAPDFAGDAQAAAELAFSYMQGRGVEQSLASARDWFRKAGELGSPECRMIYLSLLANGTGGDRDWGRALQLLKELASQASRAASELRLIEAMGLDDQGNPASSFAARPISETPQAGVFENFLTPQECSFLAQAAAPAFRPAAVGMTSSGQTMRSAVRTCETAAFPWVAETPAIHAINRRIASASGTQAEWGETLQVLRYHPGQEFKPHRDCTEATDNQRVLTMLVYLNDAYTGGETLFLKNGLEVRGKLGDALLFRNADDSGQPDPDSLHAGLPVKTGMKLVASRWIRQKRFGPTA